MTPRTLVPYVIALFVADLAVAGGLLFVAKTRSGLQKRFETMKADLLARQKAGTLPPEWQGKDIPGLDLAQIQKALPPDAHLALDVADFLATHRVTLVAAVLLLCLGAAALFNRWHGPGELPVQPPGGPVRATALPASPDRSPAPKMP